MSEGTELAVMLTLSGLLIAICMVIAAAIFAAPGFVVLALVGYEDIGFWNSAAAGFGSIILGGVLATIIQAMRG